MYINDKVPLDGKSQEEILREITRSFLDRDFTRYYEVLSDTLLDEDEIAKRPDFYIKLSRILSRQARIVPELIENRVEFQYIAEDMIDTGKSELAGPGSALLKVCSRISAAREKKELIGASSIIYFPPFQEGTAGDFFEKYSAELKGLFIEELDMKWEFSGDIDRNLAFLCELASIGDGAAAACAEKWFNAKIDRPYILTVFFEDLCELLRAKGESGWLISLGELAVPFINASPALCSVLAEAHFMLSSFERAIELIKAAEENASATPYLNHIKSYALWRTGRSREALAQINKRLSEDGKDTPAVLLAGDILLEASRLGDSLKAYAYAYNIEPDSSDVIFSLARAYRECYLFDQADICMDKLSSVNNGDISRYKLGVELYIKCDREGARAFIDGSEAGKCPVLLKRAPAGRHDIKWIFADGSETGFEADLLDGYIQKFKYISNEKTVDVETSREGMITVYRGDKTVTLPELLKEFVIGDLAEMPAVEVVDFINEEIMSGIFDGPRN